MQDPTGEAASDAQKHLTLYELDLGLNHVVRKSSEPVDNGANLLIPVPGGGTDGPGGVLVCAENFIIYKNEDHPDIRAVIPRRSSLSEDRGVLIVSYATHKLKSLIFFFVQVCRSFFDKFRAQAPGKSAESVCCNQFCLMCAFRCRASMGTFTGCH